MERPRPITREWLISEMHRWAAEHEGEPPRYSDWHRSHARRQGRELEPGWPSTIGIERLFGSWSAGLRAAGFVPMRGAPTRVCDNCGASARGPLCYRCATFLERHGESWTPEAAARRSHDSYLSAHGGRINAAHERLERVVSMRNRGISNVAIGNAERVSPYAIAKLIYRARNLGMHVETIQRGRPRKKR